jgi:hypothetical protein
MKFKEFIKSAFVKKVYEEAPIGNWGAQKDDPMPKKKKKGEEEEKPLKTFNVGDVITLSDNKKSSKIPEDAWDFLITFKTFTVKKVNDKGRIDLGCNISKNTPEGGVEKTFMFNPNRFELKTPAPVSEIKPEEYETDEQAPETGVDPAEV